MEICNVNLESNGWTFEVWTDVIRTNLNRQLKWTIQSICNSNKIRTFGEEDATSAESIQNIDQFLCKYQDYLLDK